MTPLREAFCAMMAHYPGSDAIQCCNWARAESGRRALLSYVRNTARAVRRVGTTYDTHPTDVAWLPLLDALIAELTTGNIMPREDANRLLADAEAAYRAAGGT